MKTLLKTSDSVEECALCDRLYIVSANDKLPMLCPECEQRISTINKTCTKCGKLLTVEEKIYYGILCEACEHGI